MGWGFRKSINIGPIRGTITPNGIGKSIGFLGFRFGINSEGRKYWSFGIPKTELYYLKYFK